MLDRSHVVSNEATITCTMIYLPHNTDCEYRHICHIFPSLEVPSSIALRGRSILPVLRNCLILDEMCDEVNGQNAFYASYLFQDS